MGIYKAFIKGLTGEYNAVEFGDNRGEGLEFYLSIKGLLKWVAKYANMFSKSAEIIKVDWESDKPMFLYSTSISCNLDKIYIRNEYVGTSEGTLKTDGIKPFRPITQFNTEKYSTLVEELKTQANPTVNPSIYPSLGNLNNVYVNIIYLSEALAQKSDNKDNKVTIREFLQTVCDGINKALGSINDLQVIINVDETIETLTIVDYQHKRIKGIPKPQEPTELKAQGLGSMLKTIQAQSSITPELASMISIGAQAQEQPVGEEATSFTLLSKGLTDKVYPTKRIGDDNTLEKKEKALKAINGKFNNAISTYTLLINNQKAKNDVNGPIKLASSDKSNQENIAVELYKACLGKFTQTGQTSTALIPIKLDLTLYGLAGIKIYQKFKLSNDVLPISYKGNYEFIILGVSHTVDTSKWETTISALISIRDQKIEKESKTLAPFAIPLEITSGTSNTTGGSQPAGCPAPGTNIVKNGWGGFEQPFKRTVLTYEQAKAAIVAAAPGNKNLQIAVLAVIIQEQGRGGKIKGFNHNYGGFDITRGGWKFTTIGASNTDGYVIATEGGTKCKIAYVSFKEAASFFKVKINSFKRKGFGKPLTGKQVANLWYTKWNGKGSRLFWEKNELGYRDKYPTVEEYDKFVVSNFEKQYYNVAKRLIG